MQKMLKTEEFELEDNSSAAFFVENGNVENERKPDDTFVSVDVIISKVGDCGLYQTFLAVLFCFANIPMTYQVLIMYFTGHSPNWRCKNGTNIFCNLTGEVSPAKVGHFNSRCRLPRHSWEFVTSRDFSFVTEYDLVCDRNPLAAFANSALYIGWGLGCIPMGIAADRYGRKPVMFISYAIVMFAVLISAFITSVWQFVLLRAITGVGITGFGISAYVLSSEFVGGRYRSALGNIFFLLGTGALMVLTLQAYYIREWRKLTIICSAPYILFMLSWVCINESPRWFSSQGKIDKSMKVLSIMAKCNGRPVPVDKIEQSSGIRKGQGSFMNLFRPRKRLFVTIPLSFGWMVVGMTFYGISLSSGDLSGNMYRDFALTSLVEVPGLAMTVFSLEKLGRRKTTVISMALAGIFCCSVAFFPEKAGNQTYNALRVAAGMAGKLFNVIAFSSYYIWTFELHPTAIRTQGLSFSSLFARVGCTSAPFISEVLKLVYPALPFLIMGVFSVIAAFSSMVLPDTSASTSLESYQGFGNEKPVEVELEQQFQGANIAHMEQDESSGDEFETGNERKSLIKALPLKRKLQVHLT